MSQKDETNFKEKIMPILRSLPNSYWDKIQQLSKRGSPDIYGCIYGQFIAIELKASAKDEADPLQVHRLQQVANAHGFGFIVYPENFLATYNFLKKIAFKHIKQKKVKKEDIQ